MNLVKFYATCEDGFYPCVGVAFECRGEQFAVHLPLPMADNLSVSHTMFGFFLPSPFTGTPDIEETIELAKKFIDSIPDEKFQRGMEKAALLKIKMNNKFVDDQWAI